MQVVHDLLAEEPRAQVELQKNASGFEIPSLTNVGTLLLATFFITNPKMCLADKDRVCTDTSAMQCLS